MAGRHHASPEADSTASFLLQELQRLGFQRREQASDLLAGPPASFAHHFSVSLHRIGRRTRLVLEIDGRSRTARVGEDYLPLLFALEGEVVGRAVTLDTRVADLDDSMRETLRERIVFAAPDTWDAGRDAAASIHAAARRLTELGAAAVVFTDVDKWKELATSAYPAHLPDDVDAALRSHRARELNLNAERVGLSRQASAWRLAPERTCPAVVVRPGWAPAPTARSQAAVAIDFVQEVSLGQNILVGLAGSQRPDEAVLLVAHHDQAGVSPTGEIFNGADDNASGVAALLEVARALRAVHGRMRRSVLVAFVGAELQGGQGSEALLRDLPLLVGPVDLRAALCLDAVGGAGRDALRVAGATDFPELGRFLDRRNERESLFAPAVFLQFVAPPETQRDSVPWRHKMTRDLLADAGIPSLLIHGEAMHVAPRRDEWGRVDVGKITSVARLLFRTTFDLVATDPLGALPAASSP
ncbi:MAG: M20/M25/M40 family metallo-hydrolase [Candidatus Latescibacterota bacterium]|nr:MAG: M20/M25/M40 family metallo-hydrolase [Candidatus Latescibacterota bacterium]